MLIHKDLPEWLKKYIYVDKEAGNVPDFQKAQLNIDANKQDAIDYFGTYFPRSYAESYCIFNNLFTVKKYSSILSQNEKISILSFGSGSGGDIIGLLEALSRFSKIRKIRIVALDGNKEFLLLLRQILQLKEIVNRYKICFEDILIPIQSDKDISFFCKKITESFDFITSFKLINELYHSNILENDCYELLTSDLSVKLKETGLFLLLDVNIPLKRKYMANLMRDGIAHFVSINKGYKILVPIPCHFNKTHFCEKCRPRKSFDTPYKLESVTYRLIGKTPFVDKIYPVFRDGMYQVQTENYCPCVHGTTIYDGYDLTI
ncbi:MAG: hypothetical protein LKF48_09185 [Prevotella sp.]|jgi:hypothetical protein|nr:hypothetical protein [Prevotella sp.]MCH4183314.1 hypothetical protein [Prevotella sp.]MCH4242102.1 hypothetical protein [Prevotella sp.]